MKYSSRILLYLLYFLIFCSIFTLNSQENSVLHILKGNAVSQRLKVLHWSIFICLFIITEIDTSIQEHITLKSGLDKLFSNLKNEV